MPQAETLPRFQCKPSGGLGGLTRRCLSSAYQQIIFLRYDNETLYLYLRPVIREFALLGYLDIAARILSDLNNYDPYHDPHGEYKELWFFWGLAEKDDGVAWPDGEKEKVRHSVRSRRNLNQLHHEPVKDAKEKNVRQVDTDVSEEEIEEELQLRAKDCSKHWYDPDRRKAANETSNPSMDVEEKFEKIQSIIKSFSEPIVSSKLFISSLQSGLTHSADLLLSMKTLESEGQNETDENERKIPSVEQLLTWYAQSLSKRYDALICIHESRQVCQLLKNGVLRRLLQVDEAKIVRYADELLVAVSKRLEQGRARPVSLPIDEALEVIQRSTHVDENYLQCVLDTPEPFFKDPATESYTTAAEERLGVQLSDDYRTFLRQTNGFGAKW
ncbi:hypothetical protein NX059_002173 [Plenodomus lindquistii]|nr:hypothetical protein NX059_002173 [Plenodomus lindquistii]